MKDNLFRTGLVAAVISLVPVSGYSQDISQIAKSDPLIITGAVGTQNAYYHSSSGGFASPLSNSVYANLNISFYGFSMPFSFYYSNSDLNFSYPRFSFNISPTYKNWTLHLGTHVLPMSPYIYNIPFEGAGLEYNGQRLRFGMFYGRLRHAINDNPLDPKARSPQYSRMGWGFKVGYGSGRHYLDLYVFKGYDRLSSLAAEWRRTTEAKENLSVALRGHTSLGNWMSLTANVAASVFSTDLSADRIHSDEIDKWDKIFDARYSSLYRFAGDVNLNLSLGGVFTSVSYKLVQPDYTSLGLSYISNNYQSLGLSMSGSLTRNIILSGNFAYQNDNLNNKQLYTTRGYVYSANAVVNLSRSLNLTAGYSGYLQQQCAGTMEVNDTTRVNRIMHNLHLAPSYSFEAGGNSHTVSLTGGYTQNKDLNPFSTGESDVKTISYGASYGVSVERIKTDFGLNYSHQTSEGYERKYTSDVISGSAGRSFLEDKNLTASLTLSACRNHIAGENTNWSVGVDLYAGYTLKKVHSFSFSAGYSRYNDMNIVDVMKYSSYDLNCSLNYNYTFTLLELKRKASKKQK